MHLKAYKKDQEIKCYGMPTIAGQDMLVASQFGIYADIFDEGSYYVCPSVVSTDPGSGKFPEFLESLKLALDKPIYFASVINKGIYPHLAKAGIGIVKDGDLYNLERKEDV